MKPMLWVFGLTGLMMVATAHANPVFTVLQPCYESSRLPSVVV
jgi:hypothetical protein